MGNCEDKEKDGSLDYLKILKALKEIPFPVGKKLLVDFLQGNIKNKSITKNALDSFNEFSSLNYSEENIKSIIDNLINNRLIELKSSKFNKYMRVLELTPKGRKELFEPCLYKKKLKNKFKNHDTVITEREKTIFKELDHFLNRYNPKQKKAIISDKNQILCIAGAGSGKTAVLTKRIEFLIKYKSIDPKKILAITFTRKSKKDMEERLELLNINTNVHTFNSFSEKILRQHASKIYKTSMRVITYTDKIMAITMALGSINFNMQQVIEKYFTINQRRNKSKEQLANIFMNDCFFFLDYFKTKNIEFYDFSKEIEEEEKSTAEMMYKVVKYLKSHMDLSGLRDFTDQVLDTIKFFKEYKENIPQYEYILVDEYQDVNAMQIELLDLLNPDNLFVVGDPRQSIFGWRGSDINYILNFNKKFPDSEIITLTKNYRSRKKIIDFMNLSIKNMNLPDIDNHFEEPGKIRLENFSSEQEEFKFVLRKILMLKIARDEIFVLARTNRQLSELSKLLRQNRIDHIVKTDEMKRPVFAGKGQVTLATIHSIKGLEAKIVFIIGANEANFPCKASDHPVIEMVKIDEYDKEEEEKRLFYVAISRAKEKLYITYTGKKHTHFINNQMLELLGKPSDTTLKSFKPTRKPVGVLTIKKTDKYGNKKKYWEDLDDSNWEDDESSKSNSYSNYNNKDSWDDMVE